MRVNTILFPTDFSPASEAAGRIARSIAKQADARLYVLHVVPPVTDPSTGADGLSRVAASLGEGLQVETALLSGRAGRSIVDYARDKHIDLIVVGTHGRSGISHAILGSVAETVVRLAPCLVLTVPAAVFAPPVTAASAPAAAAEAARPCLVCARPNPEEELICEGCRARIRAQALEQKWEAERPGRRGSPV